MCLLHGVDDELSPFSQSVQLAEELERGGMPYEFYSYEGLSHYFTTLTRLVSEFLRQLSIQDDPLADAPVVRRLSGTLSPEASIDDYRKYLEEKYGD